MRGTLHDIGLGGCVSLYIIVRLLIPTSRCVRGGSAIQREDEAPVFHTFIVATYITIIIASHGIPFGCEWGFLPTRITWSIFNPIINALPRVNYVVVIVPEVQEFRRNDFLLQS
jgi:hypothetical protein